MALDLQVDDPSVCSLGLLLDVYALFGHGDWLRCVGSPHALVPILFGLPGGIARCTWGRLLYLAWLCPLIGTVLLSLNVSGILDAGFMSEYAIQIGSALQVILLSLAIGQKFKVAQEERDASQKALLETYQQLDQELLNREKNS